MKFSIRFMLAIALFMQSKSGLFAQESVEKKPAEKKSTADLEKEYGHYQSNFYFRLNIGAGYPVANLQYADGNLTTIDKGSGALFFTQIGYTVINNLIIFAEVGTTAAQNSKISVNSVSTGNKPAKFNIPAIGLGAIYYIMPLNIYISPEIRIPQLLYETAINGGSGGYTHYLSNLGIGFGLSSGIELKVSKTMATGIGVNFLYDFPTPQNLKVIKNISQFYVGLSATVSYH